MLKIIQLHSEEELLSATPTNVNRAKYVLIVHDHVGGSAHTIVQRDREGNIKGSFRCPPDVVFVIKKDMYDTLEEPAATGDTYVTSVTVTG